MRLSVLNPDLGAGVRVKVDILCSHGVKVKIFFCRLACRVLVPRSGIKTLPPAVEAWSLNHWIAREVP